jgi:hypothetical protein
VSDLKQALHQNLTECRARLLSRLEGLSEYDLRRPLTPTGTNLLGLVKHLAGLEGQRDATLGELLILMGAETAQHAAHADIVRELIDGKAGPDHDGIFDEASWHAYAAQIQDAVTMFRET